MAQPGPSFELRATSIAEVSELFAKYHPYKSTGNCAVYAFAVFENNTPIAAYIWQPPPPGAAKSAFAAMPAGVLALSRMVAVPRSERRLQHVSKPLRWQMKNRIDRTRWPVLITYSDESVGHTGHVYLCSGWQKTKRRKAPTYTTADGRRVSSYSDGRHLLALPEGVVRGTAFIQRWENWGGVIRRGSVRGFLGELGTRARPRKEVELGEARVPVRAQGRKRARTTKEPMNSLNNFILSLRDAWCIETAASHLLAEHGEPYGQCAVTALLVQDYFDGEILRAVVETTRVGNNYVITRLSESHYWNLIPGVGELDLTREQYTRDQVIPRGEVVPRSRLLEGERARAARTPERYAALVKAYRAALRRNSWD